VPGQVGGTSSAGLFLLRHGRTGLNAGGQLRGRLDVPLDEVGRTEAERLGDTFSTVGLAVVVSSPLQRAATTAAAVARRHGLQVETDRGLADRDWGPWAGHAESEVAARFGTAEAAPGVEPFEQFLSRILEAVQRLTARAGGGPVMAVAHDAVNRALLAHLVPGLGDPASIPQRTGCWNLLRSSSRGWSALVVDAVPGDGRHPTDQCDPLR
jgi:broad specificity phosphatase PhoE